MKVLAFMLFCFGSTNSLANEKIVGSWKLQNAYCEDGSQLTGDSALSAQFLIASGVVLEFNGKSEMIMAVNIPSEVDDSICPAKAVMDYQLGVDGSKASLQLDNAVVRFDQGCEATAKIYADLRESSLPVPSASYEISIEGDKFLRFQPLLAGLTNFDCGEDLRVVEEYQKISAPD
jgi:hypothetical protein